MSKKLLLSAVSVLLIAFGSVSTVFAQGATGELGGRVVDETGSGVAGVTVTVSNERTGLSRTVTTSSGGNFNMQLPPGNYVLNSSGSGINSVTIESVMVNLGVKANLTIPVVSASIEEIVTYGTARELMAATTGETGLNISLEELSNVPVPRTIESVALLAPGTVAGDVAFGDDKTLVSFGGASVAENVYYIDGLNVTNFRNGLGGSSVPFEFYDQFQIKTGGYGAEFGRSTGGVINAVTKRGSNEFEYGLVTYFEPELLQGESPNTIRADGSFYDFNGENRREGFTTDVYLSGPIIQDRLFFYVLYEPQTSESKFTSLGSPNTMNEQKIDDDFWGGNLTWNINDDHSISYTAFSDEREIVTEQFSYDLSSTSKGSKVGEATEFRGGDNQIVRYDGNFGDTFVLSAMYGKNEYSLTDQSTNDVNCPLIIDLRDSSTDVFGAGSCWITSTVQTGYDEREAFRIDGEYYIGDHTIRAGFDREENLSVDATVYPGFSYNPSSLGGIYYRYETWDVGQQLPNGYVMADLNGDGSRVDTIRTRYIENGGNFNTVSEAWYIEDKWAINDAFTLSAGIRNETFDNANAEGATFIGIDDQWAPRIAMEWSPGGTGDQVITLNWGRYHLPIAANTNVRLSGAELDFSDYYVDDGLRDASIAPTSIDSEGQPTTVKLGGTRLTSDGTVPDTSAIIDKNLEPMFQDEWILQYERELNENWTAGIRYIYRDLSSTIDDILVDFGLQEMVDRGEFDGPVGSSNDCHYVLTNPGQPLTTNCEVYVRDGTGAITGTTLQETTISAADLGFPEAERTYEAVEITVEGQVGELNINGSYTWSKNEGNTEGYVKSDIGQDDAGITQDFDIPQLMDGALGFLPNDRTHKLKMWASYQATDRLTIGTNLRMQSGRPINAFGESHPDGTPSYGDTFYLRDANTGNFTFVPRGTAGRTPWLTQIDLAAIYSFNWGDRADVELRAEVFNVLNADSAREVYEFAEIRPDQFRLPTSFQRPRYLRFGAAIRF
ncbi:MAG: carboxypeptidase regulatory-like domain-containing protein [Gammaproteobacteria bacterium]|nr:carboxypeptidase regulatory-like domain-containing protein [Gammaproteobacteria bacterium]